MPATHCHGVNVRQAGQETCQDAGSRAAIKDLEIIQDQTERVSDGQRIQEGGDDQIGPGTVEIGRRMMGRQELSGGRCPNEPIQAGFGIPLVCRQTQPDQRQIPGSRP
jgi:hypothetical protein